MARIDDTPRSPAIRGPMDRLHHQFLMVRIFALVGILVAGLGIAGASSGGRGREPSDSVERQSVAPELSREWRWKLETVSFDHMYRSSQ